MQSGRKPKPTAVKALEGNPGKRSFNTGELKPEKRPSAVLHGWNGAGKPGILY